jgi:GTP-binding protein LepA
MDIIATYPSVIYEVEKTNGEVLHVDNPEFLPDASVIQEIREPIVKCFIMVPNEYISPLMQLILDKRGLLDHTETLDTRRVMLTCVLPLNESSWILTTRLSRSPAATARWIMSTPAIVRTSW